MLSSQFASGTDPSNADEEAKRSLLTELRRIASIGIDVPIYPPVTEAANSPTLRRICDTIVDLGLAGAMFSGLDRFSREQRTVVRERLAAKLPL